MAKNVWRYIAHSGIFSSDRTIKEYATGIWGSTVIYKNL